MKKFDRRPLALAATALLLGLTACGSGDSGQSAGSDAGVSAPAPGTENATAESESADETSDAADSGDREIAVEAVGDGPIGLTATEPAENAEDVSGRLITGPGGCFALVDDGEPQLLLFPDDAEFVLRDGQPSVTTAALGTARVGDPFESSAEPVALEDTTGIPDRCAHGEATEALLLAE
ncbi:hypothetical protein [Zhihengliuella sp.]|uniref:hypothetical protein n=1 Tax=Zhihengliuella sp. TaxID=1954483 RepID=UPI002812415A|nr:hypothetical protein [Zhihengliuella sp.]